MLEFFRSHQRLMQFLLLIVIFPSFILLGIEGYTRFGNKTQVLAEVDGQQITVDEFNMILRDRQEQMRRVLGENADTQILSYKDILLDHTIDERIMSNEVRRLKLTVSDEMLRNYMMKLPMIMQLRKPDGSLDLDAYKAVLAQRGLTPEQYQEQIRFALTLDRFVNILRSSGFVSRIQVETLAKTLAQEREIQEILFNPNDYIQNLNPSEKALKAYYETHKTDFTSPEEASIEYLVLSADDLEKSIDITDAMLQQTYQNNLIQYQEPEQRRASHILFAVDKQNNPEERQAIRVKAEKTLAILRTSPERFAQLAKQESNDPGSAVQGGDLGFFSKGMMVKPFEEAVYKLKEGEVSNIVESDFGFHLIKLTAIKPGKTQTFEDVKEKLTASMKHELAIKRFNELAEDFSNLVYDQYTSLKPISDKFKLPILRAEHITRYPNSALSKDNLLNNQKLLSAVFSDDVIKNKRNTEALQLMPNTLVAARIIAYHPATLRPLNIVHGIVRERWIASTALDLAKQEGKKALTQSPPIASVNKTRWLSRSNTNGVSSTAFAAIFRANIKVLPATIGVDLGNKGYAIYKITRVRQAQMMGEKGIQGLTEALSNASGEADYQAYMKTLRAQAKIKKNVRQNQIDI